MFKVFGSRELNLTLTRVFKFQPAKVAHFVQNFPTICPSEGKECLNRLFMTNDL